MNCTLFLLYITLNFVFSLDINTTDKFIELSDNAIVHENNYFPYIVAILKKGQYLSAGALIHDSWVLTAGDSLFLLHEAVRYIQVRLGTTNYKKGGIILPVKYFEIHPLFDDRKPQYDMALIRLPKPIKFSPSRKPIKLEKKLKRNVADFTVTAWPAFIPRYSSDGNKIESIESIRKRRTLAVSHLHPSVKEECLEMLEVYGLNDTEPLMCLDPADKRDINCSREVGAPVVYNGILRGIVSSWKPEDCGSFKSLIMVNVVTAHSIRSWIQSVVRDKEMRDEFEEEYDERTSQNAASDYKESESPDYPA